MKCNEATGPSECEPLMLERIRYFTGRHMTARDFCDADAYHRGMRHLHNRVMHGWGVACGLEVQAHPRPECGVIVKCGMAIDCCGREIVVQRALAQRIPWDLWPALSTAGDARDPSFVLVLCLEYCEVQTEKVPVLYSHDACSSAHYEDGRIRESHRLHWHVVKEDELEGYGWHTPRSCPPDDPAKPHSPCGPAANPMPCGPEDASCCIDPKCPPDHCVALAVVRGIEAEPKVDTEGRRSIAEAREHLTHICWISWPHGGLMKFSDFRQLSLRFDRMLAAPLDSFAAGPVGINERTFQVQYGAQREDLDFVLYDKVPPHLMPDRRTAIFDIAPSDDYLNSTIHVTLRCDFILDCRDNPVDGDHLRGRRPTGDGVAGGTFESWFRVVSDDEYDRLTQATTKTGGQA